ncbi:MAG: LytTR family transcriptional regulator DNA-binding domain-containing protein [Prevotellaceae bacterium]|nr:LytTR family transcriptional regulator DNA-binding domain-containing protein [Prevotellaceae bacterium]
MNKKRFLYLNSRDEFFRMSISRIVYFEADGNYTNFVLAGKLKGTAMMNLAKMQDTLSERLKEEASIFARVGKRHIINLNYVYRIEVLRQRLTLSDGENFAYQLAISKDALRKLKEMYVSGIKGRAAEQEDNSEITDQNDKDNG